MKILISTPQFLPILNGVTFRVKMMTDYFTKMGHQVIIITPNKLCDKKYKNTNVHIFKDKKLPQLFGGESYKDVFLYDQNYIEKQLEKVSKNIDIIHIIGPEVCQPFINISNKLKIPVVMSYNTETVEFLEKSSLFNYEMSLSFNRTWQYLANNYNIPLIFGTSIESIKINKERGIIGENQRTKLMLPIIDHDKFKKIDKKLEIFKNGKFNVIYCGRIAPEKKIDVLIKTMQFTSKTRLFIIGDGAYLNNLKEIAKEFKVDDKVNFLGKIPNNELAKYYSSADIFATASECETCGFTTIEAMTCGLTALVYPRGGSINLIDDGVNGFFCKNEKEFAKKIRLLRKDKNKLIKMSEEALKSTQDYSIEKSCGQLLKDYQFEIDNYKEIDNPSPWKFGLIFPFRE